MYDQIERNRMEMVLALRSGRYRQITGTYYNSRANEYCFLGLAFKLFMQEPRQLAISDTLCRDLIKLIGIKKLYLNENLSLWKLVKYNDDGKTFLELADILVKDYGFPDVYIWELQADLQEVAA